MAQRSRRSRSEPERLHALDESFLLWETPNTPMHIAAVLVFEPGPLATADGALDVSTLRKAVLAGVARVPRYRQRVLEIPVLGGHVWVDDDRFDLDFHLRHVALPRPGSAEQLARFTAGVMERPLDRRRPLWEMWIVEGLEGGRFALITKVHHCMVDGIAGVELMLRILSPDPDARPTGEEVPRAAPAPSGTELLLAELGRRARLPLEAVLGRPRAWEDLDALGRDLARRATGLVRSLARGLRPARRTSLNGPLGPHRRFAVLARDLGAVRRLARRLDCTVNDVVLATVAGALRRTLRRRGEKLREGGIRALAPVSVRRGDERGVLGNRVSVWIVELPVERAGALARVRAIRAQTAEFKRRGDALGAELLTGVAEWTSPTLLALGARAVMQLPAFNLIVTNVPGPQIPLYLCGARMVASYPVGPLFDEVGLCVALLSYDGGLYWGLTADYDLVPDLDTLAEDLRRSFEELEAAADRHRRESPAPRPGPGHEARRGT